MRERVDPRYSGGALGSGHRERLRMHFCGTIVPEHGGHVNTTAFQEYVGYLRRRHAWFSRPRARAIEDEIEFARIGIAARDPSVLQLEIPPKVKAGSA